MNEKLIHTIKLQIANKSGQIFNLSDLNCLLSKYSYASIKRTVNELSHIGYIKNIARGLYFKPKQIKKINGYTTPSCESFAKAIAIKNKWFISLTDYCALNAVGLTKQVPGSYVYVSTGPNKIYKFNNITIRFKHCKSRELVNCSTETKLLIQALKTLGKEKITRNTINSLKNLFPEDVKKRILKECGGITIWIYEKILQICQ